MISWLLNNPEVLPIVIVTIAVNVGISRFLFPAKADFSRLKTYVEELRKHDDRHMGSVQRAHERVDKMGDKLLGLALAIRGKDKNGNT